MFHDGDKERVKQCWIHINSPENDLAEPAGQATQGGPGARVMRDKQSVNDSVTPGDRESRGDNTPVTDISVNVWCPTGTANRAVRTTVTNNKVKTC